MEYLLLVATAEELNEVLMLEPPIETEEVPKQELINNIREAAGLIEERDFLTKETMDSIRALNCAPEFWPKPPKKDCKFPDKQKPGVVKEIIRFFKTQEGIITKSMLLSHLVDIFPERNSRSMKKTIDLLVPTRLNNEKNMNIKRIEEGYVHFDKEDLKKGAK